jgi:hypothetical protein
VLQEGDSSFLLKFPQLFIDTALDSCTIKRTEGKNVLELPNVAGPIRSFMLNFQRR